MRLYKFEDLVNITKALDEAGYGDDPLVIGIPVPDKAMLNRIHEDYNYRLSFEKDLDPDVSEINLIIGPIKFRYFVEESKDFET